MFMPSKVFHLQLISTYFYWSFLMTRCSFSIWILYLPPENIRKIVRGHFVSFLHFHGPKAWLHMTHHNSSLFGVRSFATCIPQVHRAIVSEHPFNVLRSGHLILLNSVLSNTHFLTLRLAEPFLAAPIIVHWIGSDLWVITFAGRWLVTLWRMYASNHKYLSIISYAPVCQYTNPKSTLRLDT